MAQSNQESLDLERARVGDALLERAQRLAPPAMKKSLATFAAVHKKFLALAATAKTAEASATAAREALQAADAAQDASVEELASALVGIGRPRIAPFKGVSRYSPSALAGLAMAREAEELAVIASKCQGLKDADARVKAAARKAAANAKTALRAAGNADKAVAAWYAHVDTRRTVESAWDNALRSVRRTARFFDAEGVTQGLHDGLFGKQAPRRKKTAAPTPAPAK